MSDSLLERLSEWHSRDKEHLDFIFSNSKRLVVIAPAGYGKTRAMISKISYEIYNRRVKNHKKILAITFSVNAAKKIYDDASSLVPELIDCENFNIDKNLNVFNYHSFAKKIIKAQGYTISENLKNLSDFDIVPDNDGKVTNILDSDELKLVEDFNEALNNCDEDLFKALLEGYCTLLKDKLIPHSIITYNGLISIASELLENKVVLDFYVKLYEVIIIDEFQDTNLLAMSLIKKFFVDSNKIYLIGDHLQRIYGFLGAIENVFNKVIDEFSFDKIEFFTNYRFIDNEKLNKLNLALRELMDEYSTNNLKQTGELKLGLYKSKDSVYSDVLRHVEENISYGYNNAILVRANYNAEDFIQELQSKGIKFFNGLFGDENVEYKLFHEIALSIFLEKSTKRKLITRRVINSTYDELKNRMREITNDRNIFESLLELLSILFEKVKQSNLDKDQKYDEIIYTLESKTLKRLMNEVNEKLILTTIHGSKGLEWDFVYLIELNSFSLPSSRSVCGACKKESSFSETEYVCNFLFTNSVKEAFLSELILFYVAVTRARKDVIVYAETEKNKFGYPKKLSCLGNLPNIEYIRDYD